MDTYTKKLPVETQYRVWSEPTVQNLKVWLAARYLYNYLDSKVVDKEFFFLLAYGR